MIRVLHVLGGLNLGGAETMVMNLYRAMDRTQIQFDFIIHLQGKQAYEEEVLSYGGKIYRFPAFTGKNILEERKRWKQFFSEHKEYKILHSHVRSYASIYLPIAKKSGLTTIIHSHNTSNGKGITSMAKHIMQLPLRYQADYLFACSNIAGKWLFGKNVDKKSNYRVFPNAINTQRFNFDREKRLEVRKILNITNKFVVGHVGRMTKQKNHIFLINIFEQIAKDREDAVLLLVGDGELRDSIKSYITAKGLNNKVIMIGNKNNTQDYYQAMDVFVFPSLWEGFGIVVIEAQTTGLPCFVAESVPEEANLDDKLFYKFLLCEGEKEWAKAIENMEDNVDRVGRVENACEKGFDIFENALQLEKLYLTMEK